MHANDWTVNVIKGPSPRVLTLRREIEKLAQSRDGWEMTSQVLR